MSLTALKRILVLFLFASLAGLFLQAVRLPQEAVANPQAPSLTFEGGSGDTPATAVIIKGAPDYVAVVAGEYQYLAKKFGKPDQDWQVAEKEVYQRGDQVYDLIRIEFPNGAKQYVFFNITPYFNKENR
jgi:hypothetical protein